MAGPAGRREMAGRPLQPIWPPLKIAYTAFIAVVAATYWHAYGPYHLLWLCDVAMLMMAAAVWLESRLLASMVCVGFLPTELLWTVDFVIQPVVPGNGMSIADYMYSTGLPLVLRVLSGFHVVLLGMMVVTLARWGYDRRALMRQLPVSWVLFVVTWLTTRPERNINWVYGWGDSPQNVASEWAYFLFALAVVTATHVLAHLALRVIVRERAA